MGASQMVYGMENLSHGGMSIPTQDALGQYKLTGSELSNYNGSVEAFKMARMQSALDNFVETETWDADMNMHTAVDAFVDASVAVAEVVRVATIAEEVQTLKTTDEESAITLGENLQEYVTSNEVELTENEAATYNDSLEMVEEAVATFTAYTVINNSSELKAELQNRMNTEQAYADATSEIAFEYTNSGAQVTFQFASTQNEVAQSFTVDVTDYLSTLQNQEFFEAGENSYDYASFSSSCISNMNAGVSSCIPRSGGNSSGPPPNVLLYDSNDGGNTFFIRGYTDEYGTVINYVEGDDVYDPQTGDLIGYFTGGTTQCNAGYEGYCNG